MLRIEVSDHKLTVMVPYSMLYYQNVPLRIESPKIQAIGGCVNTMVKKVATAPSITGLCSKEHRRAMYVKQI